jgi:two-component system alkaline phosphatase synthesis response regulator PhoP
MTSILVVDDKFNMRRMLEQYLTEQGFQIQTASNGVEALYTSRHFQPDLILLDIMMPQMDGYEFLRQFRKEKKNPVIIITALEEEADAVRGLDLGADDYVIKPFRLHELTSRIRAVLRRFEASEPDGRLLEIWDIKIDETRHTVQVRGQTINLTPTEFELLDVFARWPGRVFTREQLTEHLAQRGYSGAASTINVHIRNLRAKIELNADQPQYIETVFGVGYRLANRN